MNSDTVVMLIRYAMLLVGGIVVQRGWASDGQIELMIGAVTAMVPIVWGVYVKWGTRAVPEKTAERVDVPRVSQVTGEKK